MSSVLMSIIPIPVIIALLYAFTITESYDFTVCLRRIELDSYWVSTLFGVNPYAKVLVNDNEMLETNYGNTQVVNFGVDDYCVELYLYGKYTVRLWESENLDDILICGFYDTITAADVGLNQYSCTDEHGYTNYMDWYVSTINTPVTRDNIEFQGTAINMPNGETLETCKSACASNSNCNYLSYGKLNGNSADICRMYTSYDTAVKNTEITSVSYMCNVPLYNNLGSGTCSTTDNYNTEDCGWDGGDCCVATNAAVADNTNCLDPLNQGTTTTTASGVTIANVKYEGSAINIPNGETLESCKAECESTSDCNYLSYGKIYGNSADICRMYTTYDTAVKDEYVTSVSYMCNVVYFDYIASGTCSTGDYNTADCGWDGGDCCTATNSALSHNNYCLDPLNQPTTTTAPSTTTASTTHVIVADLSVCEFILNGVDNAEFSWIGNGVCNAAEGTTNIYTYYLNGAGGTTTINDAVCNYDGGDCCVTTNPGLNNDDNCMDPVHTTTTTTPAPTTTTNGDGGDDENVQQSMTYSQGTNVIIMVGVAILCIVGIVN